MSIGEDDAAETLDGAQQLSAETLEVAEAAAAAAEAAAEEEDDDDLLMMEALR
jgi:hypothetical protein